MIDWKLDGFLPTQRQPAPKVETAGDRDVVLARTGAAAIDLFVCYVLLEFPLIYVASVLFSGPYEALGGAVVPLSLLVLLPLYVTYSFTFEWRYGRTPGKVNRGLLVVMADGSQCTLRASAVRNLCRYVDLLGVPPLVVGLGVALATDGRRVGDRAAGTIVVRSTAPADLETAVTADADTSAAARASGDEKN
ncbi:transporter (plasmid) [Halostagnicola larsenii XH-48]|uniref:Transporter n=1 Tax=Halostagnicola larsenii XH-48 TaxID=797299 RepID=W0JTT4_9EURY|nr:RDD family protein [Halostagnicola larsenii]AHG01994.1 transporter [Halostagnicola larsenii XH-48]